VRFLFRVLTMMIQEVWTPQNPLVLKIVTEEKGIGLVQENM